MKNCYMLNIENQSKYNTEKGTICTKEELQQENIVTTFNSYIEQNEDEIDMTNCYKWIYNAGKYPTWNTATKWNGTAWTE